jgi:Gly-Xaa carboxypeptidase
MTGNSDTRYYWNLTENIYRFTPVREGGRYNMHTVDEKIGMVEHVEGVKFYAQMILNSDRT